MPTQKQPPLPVPEQDAVTPFWMGHLPVRYAWTACALATAAIAVDFALRLFSAHEGQEQVTAAAIATAWTALAYVWTRCAAALAQNPTDPPASGTKDQQLRNS